MEERKFKVGDKVKWVRHTKHSMKGIGLEEQWGTIYEVTKAGRERVPYPYTIHRLDGKIFGLMAEDELERAKSIKDTIGDLE